MAKGDVHVTWREDAKKWAVESEGASRAGSLHERKSAAESAGRSTAKRRGAELLVHDQGGRVKERNTYKRDPFPPRG